MRTLLLLALLIPVTRAEPGASVAWKLPATEMVRYFEQVRERKAPRATVSLVREGTVQPTEHRVRAAAGFRYSTTRPHAWASMTCAGIASLAIAREQLEHKRKLSPKLAAHIGHLILGGWAWLDRHWAMDRHALHPRGTWYHYYLKRATAPVVLTR